MSAALVAAVVALLIFPISAQSGEVPPKLVDGFNRLGFRLYNSLAREPANIVMSPLSVGTAMAMTFAGARGETQAEGARVLQFGAQFAAIPGASRQLAAEVLRRSNDGDVTVNIANALHLTRVGGLVAQSYSDLLRENFDAEIFKGSDVTAVNDWVRAKTDGKITAILPRLDPNSVGVIVNAVYFKGKWEAPFDGKETRPDQFFLSGQKTVQVSTMHQNGNFKTLRTGDLMAIVLPYSGNRWEMVIVVPMRAEPSIADDGAMVQQVLSKLAQSAFERVALSMPKFKSEFGVDLVQPLKTLGLNLAFDAEGADFSGITGGQQDAERIHISQVQHKAVIDVSEAGTEAAAATAVEIATRSLPPPAKRFAVDRPFTYLVVDRSSGAVLFIGRVTDPR